MRMANGHASHGIGINNKYTHCEEIKKTKPEQSSVNFSEAIRMLSPLPQFIGTALLLLRVSWVKAAKSEP